jgi:hypothetical protein
MIAILLAPYFLLGFVFSAQAANVADPSRPPFAVVTKILGESRADGRKLTQGYRIDYSTTIVTGERAFVQLTVEKWNAKINIGSSSTMKVDFQGERKYTFEHGSCRWSTLKKNSDDSGALKGNIHTPHVSLGVRGTDFLLRANKDFSESEVYVLEGEVQMESIVNKMDSAFVKAGQWMGVGGRFGDKISGPIQLSPEHIKRLKNAELVW